MSNVNFNAHGAENLTTKSEDYFEPNQQTLAFPLQKKHGKNRTKLLSRDEFYKGRLRMQTGEAMLVWVPRSQNDKLNGYRNSGYPRTQFTIQVAYPVHHNKLGYSTNLNIRTRLRQLGPRPHLSFL